MVTLEEQLLDLVARLHVAENDLCPQLDDAEIKLEKVNKRYKRLKGREPNLWFQSFIVALSVSLIFALIMQNTLRGKPSKIIVAALCVSAVVGVILNILRAKAVYSIRRKRADAWWNDTGKEAALTINNAIANMRQSMYEYVAENPLLAQIPEHWWSEYDCKALYSLVLQHRASSLAEAIALYESILENARRREQEIERHYRECEAQAEMQRRLDQAERDRSAALFALEDIRYHIKHGD